MKKNILLLLFSVLISTYNVDAQNKKYKNQYNKNRSISVKFVESPDIKIDGVLDEPVWNLAEATTGFWQHFPTDKLQATEQTEVKMIYNHEALYIAAKVYTVGNNYNTQSLERDSGGGISNDNIAFVFDTFSDRNNAYYFGVTPFGVLRDGLMSRGGVDGLKNLDLQWDTTWKAEVQQYDGYYTVELWIPTFAFKYNDGVESWRFNCYRNDAQSQINSTWAKIPRNRETEDLGFMGTMKFERPLGKVRNPIAIIPYALTTTGANYDDGTTNTKFNAGLDAKIPIGSSSNLDLTVNPDFSSTSPPEGSTNITRFEVNIDEQRQFFLDNSDLFANYGKAKQAQPFYSRRIGYGKDKDKNDIEVPIIAGARFTGKLNKDLRVGLINVQTAEIAEENIPANNNLVVSVEQKVFKKSNISAFFINRQATSSPDSMKTKDKFNRVFGADFNYFSNNNRWNGKAYLHKSVSPEAGDKDLSAGGFLYYNSRKFTSQTNARYVGGDFRSDLGFIKRPNSAMVSEKFGPKFYPKNKNINMIGVFFLGTLDFQPVRTDPSFPVISDYSYSFQYRMKFSNQTEFRVDYTRRYTYLDKPFDPTKTPEGKENPIPVGDYHYGDVFVKYTSDKSRLFSYVIEGTEGTYYNGRKFTGKLTLNYRIQPFFNTSLKSTLDYIRLPAPHPEYTSVVYLGPKFNFTFTKKLFWTTEVQFNSQNESMGVYSKLQWRYRPLSDIFLIYTDGYHTGNDTEPFAPRFRSIFLKATFWLNI